MCFRDCTRSFCRRTLDNGLWQASPRAWLSPAGSERSAWALCYCLRGRDSWPLELGPGCWHGTSEAYVSAGAGLGPSAHLATRTGWISAALSPDWHVETAVVVVMIFNTSTEQAAL